jgi:competence protein ComEC
MERFHWRDLGARPLFFPASCLALGAWHLRREPGSSPGLFLLGLGAAGCVVALVLHRRTGAHLLALAGLAAIGSGLATLEAAPLVPEGVPAPGRGQIQLEGRVESVDRGPETARLVLAVARADGRPARFRVLLYGPSGPPRVAAGDRIALTARLKPELPAGNPGQLDMARSRARRAILFHASVDPDRVVLLSEAPGWRRVLERARAEVAAAVAERAPSPAAAALYSALATGDRAALPDPVEESFARSGLAHVLSVSGLHVAALALAVFAAARWLLVRLWRPARRHDARRLAAPLALPVVWAYVLFTGWQPPAVRSAAMLSAALLGLSAMRRADALSTVAISALALLALDPAGVGDLSLQLSFTAVVALIVLSPALRAAVPWEPPQPSAHRDLRYRAARLLNAGLGLVCAGAAVTLATLPLCAAAFHRVSLIGVLANVVGAPLVSAVTVLAAAGGGAHLALGALAAPVLVLGTWASQLLLWLADLAARPGWAAPPLPSFGPGASAAYAAGLAAFALGRGRWRWLGLLAPAALAAVLLAPLAGRPPLSVTFLSVGHGDAIVISSGGEHLLVDGGGVPGGADVGRKVVLPFLAEEGIHRLSLAVLSHPHPDHALGLISTLSHVKADRVWMPRGPDPGDLSLQLRAAAGDAEVEEVTAGRAPFRLGLATVEVLGPPEDQLLLEGVNDRSVVLRVRLGEVSFLLTGDIEAAAESALDPGAVTVLKAAHHGSRTSSTEEFLERARPRYVVFSVGAGNRYGLPAPEVEARAVAIGAECLRTDRLGAIRFEVDGQGVRLETFRARLPWP